MCRAVVAADGVAALAVDSATDPEGRCEKWQEAEKVVLEAANVVPMDQPTNN